MANAKQREGERSLPKSDDLYLIGQDGKVRFKSEAGPFGFDPKALTAALQGR